MGWFPFPRRDPSPSPVPTDASATVSKDAEGSGRVPADGHAGGDEAAIPPADRRDYSVADGLNTFAWDLFGHLRRKRGNIFFSPFSLHTALGMAWAGSSGETAAEFAKVLHALADEDAHHAQAAALASRHRGSREYVLAVANRLFARKDLTFHARFLTTCADVYDSPLEQVVFPEPGRTRINLWVAEQTRGCILNLLPDVPRDTQVVLVNAVYFKGAWKEPFKPEATRDGKFHLDSQRDVTVAFMNRTDHMLMGETQDAWMVELPYKGDRIAMDLIVPKVLHGLAGLAMDRFILPAAFSKLREKRVNLSLPRFSLRWGLELVSALQSLGLTRAFGRSDFTRMSAEPVVLSRVFHQAFVEVNEQGTVAAAASAVLGRRSIRVPEIRINVDHPFLFVIRDLETGAILFVGRVEDPSSGM